MCSKFKAFAVGIETIKAVCGLSALATVYISRYIMHVSQSAAFMVECVSDAKHDHLHHIKIQQFSVGIKNFFSTCNSIIAMVAILIILFLPSSLQEQPPPSSQSTTYSLADILMNLTAPGPSHTQTRKRQWEGEEDQVPEEFQPLTESTPNVSCYLKFATAWKIFS